MPKFKPGDRVTSKESGAFDGIRTISNSNIYGYYDYQLEPIGLVYEYEIELVDPETPEVPEVYTSVVDAEASANGSHKTSFCLEGDLDIGEIMERLLDPEDEHLQYLRAGKYIVSRPASSHYADVRTIEIEEVNSPKFRLKAR